MRLRSETRGVDRGRERESQEGQSTGLGYHAIGKARSTKKRQRAKTLMTGNRDKGKAEQSWVWVGRA